MEEALVPKEGGMFANPRNTRTESIW